MRLHRRLLPVLFLGLAACVAHAEAAPLARSARIAVVVSHDDAPYKEALAGFQKSVERSGVKAGYHLHFLQGDAGRARAALERVRQQGADVVFAIGSLAAQTAGRGLPETPIVAGLVLNADDLGGAGNATGVFLELPAETEFVWLKRFLPGQKNVGVLHSRARSPVWIRAAAQAAKAAGLTLHARSVESPTEIPDALESLGSRADVLWGVPDSVVITPQTAKPILLFSLRNRIPFVGLSRSWVRAGALYALDRDYADIGEQCGGMAVRILRGTPVSAIPPEPARKVVYAVNLKTARHMKLNIPEPLVRGAVEIVE
ncbi:MAG: ABC transporter substrate-binding protein [Nitrospirota bacterium]